MQENNPTGQQTTTTAEPSSIALDDYYPDNGHGRNICFVETDGRRIFSNYSYLVRCECDPETTMIIVSFTTHTLVLRGVNLENLFYDLMNQVIKQITCRDKRYNLIGKNEIPVVNEIAVENTKA